MTVAAVFVLVAALPPAPRRANAVSPRTESAPPLERRPGVPSSGGGGGAAAAAAGGVDER